MKDKTINDLQTKTEEKICEILEVGIQGNNLEALGELIDIYKDTKEVENMRYNEYGNYGNYNDYGRDSYGRERYGRRGYDSKYRGYGHLERMGNEYGRYNESRERYGASEDSMRSLKYMLESMEDFARMLKEEAQSQEEVQMIRQTAQRIAQM